MCPDFVMEKLGGVDEGEAFRRYREYVYEVSGLGERRGIKEPIIDEERRLGYRISMREVLLRRCRYFSDECVLSGGALSPRHFTVLWSCWDCIVSRGPTVYSLGWISTLSAVFDRCDPKEIPTQWHCL